MSGKRVLFCALMPEFDRDSGSRRVLHQLEFLQESGWTITFVSQHANCKERYVRTLQQRGIAVFRGADCVPQLIGTGDYSLAIFSLWHIAESQLETVRHLSPSTRIIVDSVDLHFLRLSRQAFQHRTDQSLARLDRQYGDDAVRELNVYAASDAVLTVSQREAELIDDFLSEKGLAFTTPDCENVNTSKVPGNKRRGALFVGCFRHAPNLDAVRYLKENIAPRIDPELLKRHPIQIVGDGLDAATHKELERTPGFEVIGWVPEVEPWFENARAFIVPLRFGAGTKRKVLQAMLAGTPTVTTSVGAEGFELRDAEHAFVADDPQEFAERISQLLTEDCVWDRLREKGRQHVLASHGRGPAYARFQFAVQTTLKRNPKVGAATDASSASVTPRAAYQRMVRRLIRAAVDIIPDQARALVVSKGDDALLEIPGIKAMHFPQEANGSYTGYHPATDSDAISRLQHLLAAGTNYLVIPSTSLWWLDHYKEWSEHLAKNWEQLFADPDIGHIYIARKLRVSPDITLTEPRHAPLSTKQEDVQLIAFYLPQFHPIPENDRWWGHGFTEWTNVSKAKPLFTGHAQPRRPSDLGYYDLRLPEVRIAQADLARSYGLHGFCYYHYWFGGKRLLERPFEEVLRSGEPNFPFCLCWANEPWSRRWDGSDKDILQAQTYSHEDDVAHIRWLAKALADPRAIHIDGKPALLIYQAKDLPEPARTAETWRREAVRLGIGDIHLVTVETGWDSGWDATASGFDAKVLFQPQFSTLNSLPRLPTGAEGPRVYDYDTAWRILAEPPPVSYPRYDTVFPSWDNTARKERAGWVVHSATPESYEQWLTLAVDRAVTRPPGKRVVFVNAWNEWAEGAYLEPDHLHGRKYLEATKRVVERSREKTRPQPANALGEMTIGV